jgi:hypothetical protein
VHTATGSIAGFLVGWHVGVRGELIVGRLAPSWSAALCGTRRVKRKTGTFGSGNPSQAGSRLAAFGMARLVSEIWHDQLGSHMTRGYHA